jgi:hypothetical protein
MGVGFAAARLQAALGVSRRLGGCVCVNVSRETVQCAACLLLRERVGGAAFFAGVFAMGLCGGGG